EMLLEIDCVILDNRASFVNLFGTIVIMKRLWVGILIIALAVMALGLYSYRDRFLPRSATAERVTIGVVTWIGYGPFFIGVEKAIFRKYGVDLDIKIMDGPGEREAAWAAGQFDLLPNTPDALVILANSQALNGRVILSLDNSRGADGIVSRASII